MQTNSLISAEMCKNPSAKAKIPIAIILFRMMNVMRNAQSGGGGGEWFEKRTSCHKNERHTVKLNSLENRAVVTFK